LRLPGRFEDARRSPPNDNPASVCLRLELQRSRLLSEILASGGCPLRAAPGRRWLPWPAVAALAGGGCPGRRWLPWPAVAALAGGGCPGRWWLPWPVVATPSGARCRSGQNALNRTIRDGQTEIAARWFDRDPWVWAHCPHRLWRVADRRQGRVYDDGADLWRPDHRRRGRAPRVRRATPRGGSSRSRCRRGVRGARSVQRNRRSRWPAPRPR
jgi:hypothetical protein